MVAFCVAIPFTVGAQADGVSCHATETFDLYVQAGAVKPGCALGGASSIQKEVLRSVPPDLLVKEEASKVVTSIDVALQKVAVEALQDGLVSYDRRHGWRGPLGHVDSRGDWSTEIAQFRKPDAALDAWRVAMVLDVGIDGAKIGFRDATEGFIHFKSLRWARQWVTGQKVGPAVSHADDVLRVGDIVLVEKIHDDPSEQAVVGAFALRQIPNISGAIIVMDPYTGRVLALSDGFQTSPSADSRISQIKHPLGTAILPFTYLTALDNGYTPSSMVLDAPITEGDGAGIENYGGKFYGPTTLRTGLEKSRLVTSMRLAQGVGLKKVAASLRKLNVTEDLSDGHQMVLGSAKGTLLDITSAYAMIANGGVSVVPRFFKRIEKVNGEGLLEPDSHRIRSQRLMDPVTAYQMVSLMQGVAQRGVGQRVNIPGKAIGAVSGDVADGGGAWFVGFTPGVAVGVFLGFDDEKPLGPREMAFSAAAPIVRGVLRDVSADKGSPMFKVPDGVRFLNVSRPTGKKAKAEDKDVILEVFKVTDDLSILE